MKEELIEWRLNEMQKWLSQIDKKMDDLAIRMTQLETAAHVRAMIFGALAGTIPMAVEFFYQMVRTK